jgi:hypothetical protein
MKNKRFTHQPGQPFKGEVPAGASQSAEKIFTASRYISPGVFAELCPSRDFRSNECRWTCPTK